MSPTYNGRFVQLKIIKSNITIYSDFADLVWWMNSMWGTHDWHICKGNCCKLFTAFLSHLLSIIYFVVRTEQYIESVAGIQHSRYYKVWSVLYIIKKKLGFWDIGRNISTFTENLVDLKHTCSTKHYPNVINFPHA